MITAIASNSTTTIKDIFFFFISISFFPNRELPFLLFNNDKQASKQINASMSLSNLGEQLDLFNEQLGYQ